MSIDLNLPGLTMYAGMEQRSLEWYQARCGVVTASIVGSLLTPSGLKPANNDTSRGLMNTLIAERITGHVEPTYVSQDMLRGQLDEPLARALYADTHKVAVTELGFMVREFDNVRIGYSPDGLVGGDGLIEIKSRNPKEQISFILSGQIPHDHMAQMQTGMLVSGRSWCDYVSYAGGLPMVTKRVEADLEWRVSILDAVREFEARLIEAMAAYYVKTSGLPIPERIDYFGDVEI